LFLFVDVVELLLQQSRKRQQQQPLTIHDLVNCELNKLVTVNGALRWRKRGRRDVVVGMRGRRMCC